MEGRLGLLDRKKSLFYPVLVAVLFDSITTQYKACKHLRFSVKDFSKASPHKVHIPNQENTEINI